MFPLSEGLEVVASRVCELRDLPEHALGGMGLEPRIRPRIDVQPRASQSLSVSVRISDHFQVEVQPQELKNIVRGPATLFTQLAGTMGARARRPLGPLFGSRMMVTGCGAESPSRLRTGSLGGPE